MIQREFLTLDIGALGKLDKGRVGTLFAAAMEQVIDGLHDDESDRSKGWAKGAIVIEIGLEGRHPANGGDIHATVRVSAKLPKATPSGSALTLIGGALAFDATPDAQESLPFALSAVKE